MNINRSLCTAVRYVAQHLPLILVFSKYDDIVNYYHQVLFLACYLFLVLLNFNDVSNPIPGPQFMLRLSFFVQVMTSEMICLS